MLIALREVGSESCSGMTGPHSHTLPCEQRTFFLVPTPVYKQSLGPCTMNHAQVTDSRLSHKHLPTAGADFGVILGGGGYDFRYFVRFIRPLHSIYRCASFLLRFIRLWSGGRRTQLQWSADASKREWPNVEVTQPILHCQEASSAPSSLTIKCHECLRWTTQ